MGANDTDQLVKWLEKALDEEVSEVPLPQLEPVVPDDLRF